MRHHTPSLYNTITRPLLTQEGEKEVWKKKHISFPICAVFSYDFSRISSGQTHLPFVIFCAGCPCAYIRQKQCKVSVQPKLPKNRYSLDVLYWWHHHHLNPEARQETICIYPVAAAQLAALPAHVHQCSGQKYILVINLPFFEEKNI